MVPQKVLNDFPVKNKAIHKDVLDFKFNYNKIKWFFNVIQKLFHFKTNCLKRVINQLTIDFFFSNLVSKIMFLCLKIKTAVTINLKNEFLKRYYIDFELKNTFIFWKLIKSYLPQNQICSLALKFHVFLKPTMFSQNHLNDHRRPLYKFSAPYRLRPVWRILTSPLLSVKKRKKLLTR